MAQDVALWGVAYTDVPEVRVPKQGGGMAAFHDVSDTTASAEDVAQGKLFHAADGTLTTGTASGGGGDDGSFKAVIENSAYDVVIPEGTTSIRSHAFDGATKIRIASIPDSVTSLGSYAFAYCAGITLDSLPSGLMTIGPYAFRQCSGVTFSVIPDGVTALDSESFFGCESIEHIRGNGAITYFASGSFNYCTNLTTARFPRATSAALNASFGYNTSSSTSTYPCKKLELLDIGSTKAISANALKWCTSLTTLILRRSDAICTLSNTSAFEYTPMRGYNSQTGTVYVPQALIETYKTATNWKTLYNAVHLTFAAIEGSEYELGD